MSPTRVVALVLAALGVSAFFAPWFLVVLGAMILAIAVGIDAWSGRRSPGIHRKVPSILSRGVPSPMSISVASGRSAVDVRQPISPDLVVEPASGSNGLDATIRAGRRGHHELPSVVTQTRGPLGLTAWTREHRPTHNAVSVYPDLPAAARLARAVQTGRFSPDGKRRQGPLGLGTDFESIRDYVPDDDIRQVNWPATIRQQRPMSNQYRVEQDREVVCMLDAGRLMVGPVALASSTGETRIGTRFDAAMDAAAAMAAVADVLGDRFGAVVFDDEVRRRVPPGRANGASALRLLYDVEPRPVESDYRAAFQTIVGTKRAIVLVFTDLFDEAAARELLGAIPILARRHAVVVAAITDPEYGEALASAADGPSEVHLAAVVAELLDARDRVAGSLRRSGATVVDAAPGALSSACVSAYLNLKSRARA